MDGRMYQFRREDDGSFIELGFAAMMQKDVAGFVTLDDGVQARQVPEGTTGTKVEVPQGASRPIVSDALGFCQNQIEYFEQDRQKNGFAGVEFVRDPHVPEFYRVKMSSEQVKQQYTKHRGMQDNSSINGSKAMLSECQIQAARESVIEKYGPPKLLTSTQ